MPWKTYVKIDDFFDPTPYYVQWAVWCWRKPIYYGLPLIFFVPVFLVFDGFCGLVWIFSRWIKR
jgi:hypothetical protein